MGEVWAGVHPVDGIPVAIKVISRRSSQDRAFWDLFRYEVRAMARLHHPCIAMVLDYGEIGPAQARRSDKLEVGSPYLVMEYLSGGTLGQCEPLDWTLLRSTLLEVLAALAHAHARGVIHRDLKPDNVLVGTQQDLRPGIKLADFGVAWAMEEDTPTEVEAGTLHYMAPEQHRGEWRDFGPWTDLYALGCMAWKLATGDPPFAGKRWMQLIGSHLHADPPAFEPVQTMAPGFEGWLRRLLEKWPEDRFELAADAATALMALPDPVQKGRRLRKPSMLEGLVRGETGFVVSPGRRISSVDVSVGWEDATASIPKLQTAASTTNNALPPMPKTWRRASTVEYPSTLVGAGLGLFGLREPPLTGRETERDQLWDALRQVHDTRRAQVVLLRGGVGVGKTRLVRWIGEYARELGVAKVLMATHDPTAEVGSALRQLWVRQLGLTRLKQEDWVERLLTWVARVGADPDFQVEALADTLLQTAPEGAGAHLRQRAGQERYLMYLRLLQALCRTRPVLLCLDDVQWGSDSLGFVQHLLRVSSKVPIPVMVVLAVRDDVLPQRPTEQKLLTGLLGQYPIQQLLLGSLSADERAQMLRSLLDLEPELTAQVEERAKGNALFAVQLIGDWVQRGLLERHAAGFGLRAGMKLHLPDDLHAVWSGRVERILSGLAGEAQIYLERAAVLGQDVEEEEWYASCDHIGGTGQVGYNLQAIMLRAKLVDRMLDANLAEERANGWTFTHGLFRECLERMAADADRLPAHHQAIAGMLQSRGSRDWQRLGRHLLAAGQFKEAVDPLLQSISRALRLQGVGPATTVLDACESAMKRAGVHPANVRWGWLWTYRARILRRVGKSQESVNWARRVMEEGKVHGWEGPIDVALFEAAKAQKVLRSLASATVFLERVERRLRKGKRTQHLLGSALVEHAWVARYLGELDKADDLAAQAVEVFRPQGDIIGLAVSYAVQSAIANVRGQHKTAYSLALQAVEIYEKKGMNYNLAIALNNLGDVLREDDRAQEAIAFYQRSVSLLMSFGVSSWLPEFNLAVTLLQQDQIEEAQTVLRNVEEDMTRQGPLYEAMVHGAWLPIEADAGDWRSFDRHMSEVVRLAELTGVVEIDLAWLLRRAGELAIQGRQPRRARAALSVALEQVRRLEQPEAQRMIESLLTRLP